MASTDENIRKLKERFDKGAVGKAADRGVLDLTVWAENMKKRLEKNFGTQNIWPLGNPGPYIGYRNTRSAKRHKSGQSLQKFYAQVYAGAGGDTEKISFFFNYYLYFVDMGVGAGQHLRDVDDSAPARYNKLYKTWAGMGDRQSRPALTMEFRWQMIRLEAMTLSFYQRFVENAIVYGLSDGKEDNQ
jgi:hypothetical protein